MGNKSLLIAKGFLGKEVDVVIDRPIGSKHPKYDFVYLVNYGYVPSVTAPDGEGLDAYFLGSNEPLESGSGKCIAIVHRLDDDDDKLIVVSPGVDMTKGEISRAVYFQEKWFRYEIIME